jgi:hypothetical protein
MIVEANNKILIIKKDKKDYSKKRNSTNVKNVNEKSEREQQGIAENRATLESATEADLRFLKRLKNLSEKNLRFTQGDLLLIDFVLF